MSIVSKLVLRLFSPVLMYCIDLSGCLKKGHGSFLYQFLMHHYLTAFPSGLRKPEDIINLHPQRLNSTSREEVVDHPRAWGGDVKGSVCAESQPLPGVPLWRPSTASIQGQCLPLTDDCKPLLGFVCVIVTVSSDYMHPIFCVGVQWAQKISLQHFTPHVGACCAYFVCTD